MNKNLPTKILLITAIAVFTWHFANHMTSNIGIEEMRFDQFQLRNFRAEFGSRTFSTIDKK